MGQETNGNTGQPAKRKKPASTIPGDIEFDSDISGFILSEDHAPSFVKATTRYEILDELGRGGMGIVYRAQDWQLHRNIAIKILKPQFSSRPRLIRSFIDESRIMGTLQHPCIPHVYDCGHCEDGRPFHAMMLIQGETMSTQLQDQKPGRFTTSRLLNVFARVCHAVAYAHARGIVHLDLKPGNIMIGKYGEVHLMDWGLARFEEEVNEHSVLSHHDGLDLKERVQFDRKIRVVGTLEYMSPEQATGGEHDQQTDVFCLGAILFQILTGQTIYQGNDKLDLHRQASLAILDEAHEQLENSSANRSLIRLAKQCLSRERNRRPANATVLAAEMSAYQASALERVQSDITRFFELSLDLFCIAGFDGYFRRINDNFSNVLGYTETELLSRPFIEFVHEDDQERTKTVMEVLVDGQPVVRFRNRYKSATGEYFHFEWTAKSIMDEKIVFAVARNVSDAPGK